MAGEVPALFVRFRVAGSVAGGGGVSPGDTAPVPLEDARLLVGRGDAELVEPGDAARDAWDRAHGLLPADKEGDA